MYCLCVQGIVEDGVLAKDALLLSLVRWLAHGGLSVILDGAGSRWARLELVLLPCQAATTLVLLRLHCVEMHSCVLWLVEDFVKHHRVVLAIMGALS